MALSHRLTASESDEACEYASHRSPTLVPGGDSRVRAAPSYTIHGRRVPAPAESPGPVGSTGPSPLSLFGKEQQLGPTAPAYTMQGRDAWESARPTTDDEAELDDSPGPIYVPGSDSRIRAAPAYTMAGLHAPPAPAESPGPIAVRSSKQLGPTAPAYTMQGRDAWDAATSASVVTPGPATYHPSATVGHQITAPAFSLAARCATEPVAEVGPGAGVVSRVDFSSAPAFSLGGRDAWAERTRVLDSSPGPTYAAAEDGRHKTAPAFSFGGRHDAGGERQPGWDAPAAGACGDAHRPSAPSFTLGGREAWAMAWEVEAEGKTEGPSPTRYVAPPLEKGPAFSIGRRCNVASAHGATSGPGPATYAPSRDAQLPRAPAFTIAVPTAAPTSQGTTPGPDAYTPDAESLSRHPRAPAFSLRGKPRHDDARRATPAAAAYARPDLRMAPAPSIGRRRAERPVEPTPGPADYDGAATHGGGPAFSLGGRPPSPSSASLLNPLGAPPGPASYAVNESVTAASAPAFSMGARRHERPAPDRWTEYDHQQPYLRARHPTAPAPSLRGKPPGGGAVVTAPGPGEYPTSHVTHRGHSLLGRGGGRGGGRLTERARPRSTSRGRVAASEPWVRDIYPKLPPRAPADTAGAEADTYAAHVARAASYLSAEQLQQLQSKYSNLDGLQPRE